MSWQLSAHVRDAIDKVYRTESRRILATLIRLLSDFDLAEEAMQEAFAAALTQWSRDGVPTNPRAWLLSAGRFKGIDAIRRRTRLDASLPEIAERIDAETPDFVDQLDEAVADDRLRLIFTCCHPAIGDEAQVALTLREVCGLKTEEIARAFLTSPTTLAQRIVRAKTKIRDARIPYEVPSHEELPERLESVLRVVYLVFNEGYSASSGEAVTRREMAAEAIRLGRLLVELLPEPEAIGLLALMLLHDSRSAARTSPDGDLVLLDEQDRSLWNSSQIAEGGALVQRAFLTGRPGPYAIQAAIVAVHAQALTAKETDWDRIVKLYDLLAQMSPNPIIDLNRAVAVAMRDGPAAGLAEIDTILRAGQLADYHLAHSARADMCRRMGDSVGASASYLRALELAQQEPERRFLERRLAELRG